MDSTALLSPEHQPHPPSSSRRTASASVSQSPSQPHQSSSSSSRKRATHQPQSTTSSADAAQQSSSNSQFRDVYSHPSAVQYLSQHPKRTIPKFGPYLLLQTLGEGEFGKVKLGLHSQWGEEVAVKLIRRAGVDGTTRMSKVEREIEVLKNLRHPNIVHLYDVIETDKYIGIIIEYASGGELFDHILAHRYLRERDACKLFAQLISGVWYIHSKKIVHRDLKLENLLLDRNRNVIITDFGFANKFEHKADDLMQTSCGSPCYAAPELVISEGLYVGSAVDIWSCGVILYAMLAGYLPFDDDPANPDGDNINLLYKYIINTPLTFPDYVSAEARDLLGKMLVPDPSKRSDLRTIMMHPWLEPYRYLFERSVSDLEALAIEQQRQKRLAYQRQLRNNSGNSESRREMTRSNTAVATPTATGSGSSERRAMVQSMQPIPLPSSSNQDEDAIYSSKPEPTPSSRKKEKEPKSKASKDSSKSRSKHQAANGTPTRSAPPNIVESPEPLQHQYSQPATDDVVTKEKKRKDRAMRHTIQVEYEPEPEEQQPLPPVKQTAPGKAGLLNVTPMRNDAKTYLDENTGIEISESMPATPTQFGMNMAAGPAKPVGIEDVLAKESVSAQNTPRKNSRASTQNQKFGIVVPPLNGHGHGQPASPKSPSSPSRSRINGTVSGSPPGINGFKNQSPPSSWSKATASSPLAQSPLGQSPPQPRSPTPVPDAPAASTTPSVVVETDGSSMHTPSVADSNNSTSKRKTKGLSMERIGLGRLLGTGTQEERIKEKDKKLTVNGHGHSRAATDSPTNIPPSAFTWTRKTAAAASGAASETSSTEDKSDSAQGQETVKEAKTRRRKTLSIMMDPLIRSRSNKGKTRSVTITSGPSEPAVKKEELLAAGPHTSNSSKSGSAGDSPSTPGTTFPVEIVRPVNKAPLSASTSKAQKVMSWFRGGRQRQSDDIMEGDMVIVPSDTDYGSPLQTPASFQNGSAMDSTSTINRSEIRVAITPASPEKGKQTLPPTSWLTPRSVSHGLPSAKGALQAVMSNKSANGSSSKAAYHDAIRVHHGAVDQGTVTSGAPPEVFAHVTQVLMSMGVEIQKEAEYKYRCIRPRRQRDANAAAHGSPNGGFAAFSSSGSATLNVTDTRGLPTSGGSSGMFRNLLMRRHSSRHPSTPQQALDAEFLPSTPSARSINGFDASAPSSPVVTSTLIEPLYGEKSLDQADEVRFSVELTRIDRLDDTFSLDIRRLKGNLRSYKFLYDTLRDRCNFSG